MKKNLHIFKKISFLLLSVILLPQFSVAQDGFVLYGMRDVQQSSFLNPAFASGANIVVGFPLLSNVSTGLLNTAGGINDFISKSAGSDSLYFDLSKVINNGQPVDKITEFLNMDILFAGFKAGSTFITLGIRQHLFVQALLDKDFLKLAWNGNAPYVNQTLDISHTAVNAYHLIDYHLGISVPIGDKVRVGARLHLLQGLSDISTENNRISMKTVLNSNNEYEIHARTNFSVNTSGLPDSTGFDAKNYFLNFKNAGFAIDLGVDAQLTKQISINASILNWGKVFYRSNTKTYESEKDSINFNGASIDFLNNDDPIGSIGDTLKKLFDLKEEPQNYQIKLPARILIGGEYYTKDMRNDFSLLFSGRFFKDYFEPAVSVGYSRYVSGHFTFKVNYTYIKDAPMNFGAAVVCNLSPFQIYLYSDNVTGLFQWDRQKYVQAGFGLNIRIAPRNTRSNPHNPNNIHNLRPDIVKK
jgi:hypothetical protein